MLTVLFDATILATSTRAHGIGRYAAELARGLAATASPVCIRYLTHIGLDGTPTISDDAGAAVDSLLSGAEMSRPAWAYRLRLAAARAAQKAGASVLHLPHAGATPLDTRRRGVATVVTCHDLVPLRYSEHYAGWRDGWGTGLRWLTRRRYRRADRIIAISRATADDLATLLDVPNEKVSVVLHGIDGALWSSTPEPDDAVRVSALGVEEPFLLYVGAADWRKNHLGMLQALNLANERGAGVALAWAGRLLADQQQTVGADIARLRPRVQLLGFVDDASLRALYRRALALLFVSRAEGFGYPLLESMASGCPVIAADRSSLPEVMSDAALLVDPESPSSIADAIAALRTDAALRAALVERGIRRARALTLARQAEETIAAYQAAATR